MVILAGGLIYDHIESEPDKNVEELLSLSAAIAIKLQTTKLDKTKRKQFASTYRKIATRIEEEPVCDKGYWSAFFGLKYHERQCQEKV